MSPLVIVSGGCTSASRRKTSRAKERQLLIVQPLALAIAELADDVPAAGAGAIEKAGIGILWEVVPIGPEQERPLMLTPRLTDQPEALAELQHLLAQPHLIATIAGPDEALEIRRRDVNDEIDALQTLGGLP